MEKPTLSNETTSPEPVTRPDEGTPAPDFELPSQTGDKPISLSDFRGKTLVLYFYAKDDTPG